MRLLQLGNPVGRAQFLEVYNWDKGPDNVTTTTTSEPPAFLRGPLTTATRAAEQQFNSATGNQFARPVPTPFRAFMEERFDNGEIPELPGQFNPTNIAPPGQGGNFPGGFNPIPFLTNSFNRAADITRTRLDSEFAGAGRNLGAALPARSAELQDLANNFFDPNNLFTFDPTNVLINRLSALIPNAGGTTTSQQPVFKQGLFGL
jgi:hypothetical protein